MRALACLMLLLTSSPVFAANLFEILGNALRDSQQQSRSQASYAKENIVVLDESGLNYTYFYKTRTPGTLTQYANRGWSPKDEIYFFPPNARFERREGDQDLWHIPAGGTSSMRRSRFGEGGDGRYLVANANGTLTYNSYVGSTRKERYGDWFGSDLDFYGLTWVFPENIEIVSYRSNADSKGRWRLQPPVLTFIGKDLNNFTYSVTYRIREQDVLEARTLP